MFKELAMKRILYNAFCNLHSRVFLKKERGATMVEYGLLVALIAVACATILKTLGGDLSTLFTTVDTKVNTAAS
jgi:pilus assembly protein Flp/PilA